MEEENNLSNLKRKYNKFKEKYNFVDFYELNKLFDIEDIDSETDFLIRKIRRVISDKIAGYLRFIEIILNPANAPMFFFKFIKKLDEGDKKQLTEVYETLGKFELEIVGLDLNYDEEKEANFIKRVYKLFSEDVSKKLLDVVKKMGNNSKEKKESENKSYFG